MRNVSYMQCQVLQDSSVILGWKIDRGVSKSGQNVPKWPQLGHFSIEKRPRCAPELCEVKRLRCAGETPELCEVKRLRCTGETSEVCEVKPPRGETPEESGRMGLTVRKLTEMIGTT